MGIRPHADLAVGDWLEDPDSFAADPPMIKVIERLSPCRVRVAASEKPDARTWELSFGPNDKVHIVPAALAGV